MLWAAFKTGRQEEWIYPGVDHRYAQRGGNIALSGKHGCRGGKKTGYHRADVLAMEERVRGQEDRPGEEAQKARLLTIDATRAS